MIEYIIGAIVLLSALGVLLVKKPVHASLCFLVTLLSLASLYFQLSAEFIGVMQVLVYAGAILVIFMFVIILFQDAHVKIDAFEPQSNPYLIISAGTTLTLTLAFLGGYLFQVPFKLNEISQDYGTVSSLGMLLYVDFFFPFEAVILLFLIAVVGALYLARKVES